MQKNNDTQDVHFYLRTSYNVEIRLYQSPGSLFPCFTVRWENLVSGIFSSNLKLKTCRIRKYKPKTTEYFR